MDLNALDFAVPGKSKTTPIADACSPSTGPTCDDTTTSEPFRLTAIGPSTSLLEAIPVKRTAEFGRQRKPSIRRLEVSSSELLMSFARGLFFAKIRHGYAPTLLGLGGDFDPNWNRLVTLCCPSASDPVALGLTTSGIACSCSPKWRTPLASDHKNRGARGSASTASRIARGKTISLSMQVDDKSGLLNPAWVEWLAGFPIGWTDLEESETLLTPPSLNGSADASSDRSPERDEAVGDNDHA